MRSEREILGDLWRNVLTRERRTRTELNGLRHSLAELDAFLSEKGHLVAPTCDPTECTGYTPLKYKRKWSKELKK